MKRQSTRMRDLQSVRATDNYILFEWMMRRPKFDGSLTDNSRYNRTILVEQNRLGRLEERHIRVQSFS
jgi:hypothetical protein